MADTDAQIAAKEAELAAKEAELAAAQRAINQMQVEANMINEALKALKAKALEESKPAEDSKPVPLGAKTTSVMSSLPEETEHTPDEEKKTKIYTTTASLAPVPEKKDKQTNQTTGGYNARGFLNTKADKLELQSLSEEAKDRVVEITWPKEYSSGYPLVMTESPISQLDQTGFVTNLMEAIQNYADQRPGKLKEKFKGTEYEAWVHPKIEKVIDYCPGLDSGTKGKGKGTPTKSGYAKGFAFVMCETKEQADQLCTEYSNRTAAWPILKICGQNIEEVRRNQQVLNNRIKATPSKSGSKSGSSTTGRSEYNPSAQIAARQRQIAQESYAKSLVRISGIRKDVWLDTSRIDDMKDQIKKLVSKVNARCPPPEEIRFQVSFSNPTKAKKGNAWVTFVNKDMHTPDNPLSKWFVDNWDKIRNDEFPQWMPAAEAKVEAWEKNDDHFRLR